MQVITLLSISGCRTKSLDGPDTVQLTGVPWALAGVLQIEAVMTPWTSPPGCVRRGFSAAMGSAPVHQCLPQPRVGRESVLTIKGLKRHHGHHPPGYKKGLHHCPLGTPLFTSASLKRGLQGGVACGGLFQGLAYTATGRKEGFQQGSSKATVWTLSSDGIATGEILPPAGPASMCFSR